MYGVLIPLPTHPALTLTWVIRPNLPPPCRRGTCPPSTPPPSSLPVISGRFLVLAPCLPVADLTTHRARGGGSLPVLTSKLQLYDYDANPYNPILGSWAEAS